MAITTATIIGKLKANPKQLFLADGIGAALTTLFLVAIQTIVADHFGMPKKILFFLSLIAGTYMLYSFGCYLFVRSKFKNYLKPVIIANTLYCCLTIALVFINYQGLTLLGVIYFLLEALLVSILIWVECKVVFRI